VLRFRFTCTEKRTQRRSDGTVSIKGVRFELPSFLRHQDRVVVRFRRWDLSHAWIVDPRDHGQQVCRIVPLDKHRNADGRRRSLEPQPQTAEKTGEPVPPLLRKYLAEYAATGQMPAYIPMEPQEDQDHA